MTNDVQARPGDAKMQKRRNSYEPEFIDIKQPTDTRLDHLHTHIKQDKDEHVVERLYRNRKGLMFVFRKVYRSAYLTIGASWQLINLRIHPVIPYHGD